MKTCEHKKLGKLSYHLIPWQPGLVQEAEMDWHVWYLRLQQR